jgi:hypothetical protein
MSHMETFPCDFWRPCCCKSGHDGHCWGCGCPKGEHRDGEGFPQPVSNADELSADTMAKEGTK